jgi:alpha-tubulin suppressor-like RCC1 family protein
MMDGSVRCWGDNQYGQLGDGTTTARARPVTVPGIRDAAAIVAGEGHTCALLGDGTVRCWGRNADGQLGVSVIDRSYTPVTVQNLPAADTLVAGNAHTCVILRDDRTVRCWGLNDEGQLGDNATKNQDTPVLVRGLTGAIGLAAGERHTCARLMAGGAQCWGINSDGELGDGTRTSRLVAGTPVVGLGAIDAIVAANHHTCVRLMDQTVRCWGENGDGQLGDGSAIERPMPVAVQGVAMAIAVRAGATHTCALLDEQTVRCWGRAAEGQLGEVRVASKGATLRSPGLTNVEEIAAGGLHSCARLNDGSVWCWGANGQGQLGDGSTIPRPMPVRVAW